MNRKLLPILVTALVLVGLFLGGAFLYPGFGSVRVVANLISDNAVLGIVAMGMTLVILSGGIDLSVGAVVACSSIVMATLIERGHFHPAVATLIVLVLGGGFGWAQGGLIHRYGLPAFLVTLGGMFLARGMAFVVSMESMGIGDRSFRLAQDFTWELGWKASISSAGLVFIGLFGLGLWVMHWTVFGRNIYAMGGSGESAELMGLPLARTRMSVYAVSGFCGALGGVATTLYTSSGNPAMGSGLELDAIAAVVIGGTLLSGGVGYLWGTMLGVLIFGTIQSVLIFDGRLNSWWLRIAIGTLLLVFILLQRILAVGVTRAGKGKSD